MYYLGHANLITCLTDLDDHIFERCKINRECMASLNTPIDFRALPSISLKSLRDEISQQLDCSLFPSTFVFLKSIGKCLTWVSLIFDLHQEHMSSCLHTL